jgi:hypothetical protein
MRLSTRVNCTRGSGTQESSGLWWVISRVQILVPLLQLRDDMVERDTADKPGKL